MTGKGGRPRNVFSKTDLDNLFGLAIRHGAHAVEFSRFGDIVVRLREYERRHASFGNADFKFTDSERQPDWADEIGEATE